MAKSETLAITIKVIFNKVPMGPKYQGQIPTLVLIHFEILNTAYHICMQFDPKIV